jgi:hypothetical protein
MNRSIVLVAILVVGPMAGPTLSQRATEMLVPIGQSPGVSGISSLVGTIASCDQASGGLQLTTDKGPQAASITPATKVWLDRSPAKRTNAVGALTDCVKGRRAEVKFVYEGTTRTSRAEWIKIAAE